MFRLFAIKFYLALFTSTTYIPVLVISYFLKKHDREYFFRKCFIKIIRVSFFLARVQVVTSNNMFLDDSIVFVSNHPSEMDGLLLQALLGPTTILVISSRKRYSFMGELWLRKTGVIKMTNDNKYQSLHKALRVLKRNQSLLFFFEHNTGVMGQLSLFDVGTVHVSYAAQVALQTIVIRNTRKVFSNAFSFGQRKITVEFKKHFLPEKGYGEYTLLTTNIELQGKIKARIVEIEKEISNQNA